jgi:glycosyltransferase involved in cell wall biosynthesis
MFIGFDVFDDAVACPGSAWFRTGMKILLAHNFYGSSSPSGENQVVETEKALLESKGHEVKLFSRHSDTIRAKPVLGEIEGALVTPWNPFSYKAIGRVVDEFGPDVVHVHNTFPLLSPAIFYAIGRKAARVLTLHNYRLFCAAAIPLRDGKVCTECLDTRSVWPAVKYSCYRASKIATLPLAANISLHRRLATWKNQVEAFIALTDFQRNTMVDAGLPAERVAVKPNFYPGLPQTIPWTERSRQVVFVGRLGKEKGVDLLVEAWLAWGEDAPRLVLIGDGPLKSQLMETVAKAAADNISFEGQVEPERACEWIARSRLLVLPSVCFEGFPMVLREAFAFGTPAAVSELGPLPELVGNGTVGVTFLPGNADNLRHVVASLWQDDLRLEKMSRAARTIFENKYTEDANYEQLMGIYNDAIVSGTKGI